MRLALTIAVLAGCASGGTPGEVDGTPGPGTDGSTGLPDAQACGGGDSPECPAIYVATSGSDSAAGTRDAPVKTIASGIAKAGAAGHPLVMVQVGAYAETITMSPGITVSGGYDTSWTRSASAATEITGGSPVVTFDGITVATALEGVVVRSADAMGNGLSSTAILVTGSDKIELRQVEVFPGAGANGANGAVGAVGATGGAGTIGKPGVERSTALLCANRDLPTGGPGGTSTCTRTGGVGGAPGEGDKNGGVGLAGGTGVGGTAGGAGATGVARNGTVGGIGANGAVGGSGAGGIEVGTFMGATYLGANGADGTDGTPGNGGGGGGGGGGGTTSCDSTGSSGGGGGAGGCGGRGAKGGTGGGGSFGVVALDSKVVIRGSKITAGRGGTGGSGGAGGNGGTGGNGGAGGPYGGSGEQDDGGNGAAGGRGGNGGRGGHGGGGGGGPSAALVCLGSATITIPQTMLTGGMGGTGGASQGNAGKTGTSTNAINCSFF